MRQLFYERVIRDGKGVTIMESFGTVPVPARVCIRCAAMGLMKVGRIDHIFPGAHPYCKDYDKHMAAARRLARKAARK